jgi:hypothetical protein
MKQTLAQLKAEVVSTAAAIDAILPTVPGVPYEKCGTEGRRRYDALADALQKNRTAASIWRAARKS